MALNIKKLLYAYNDFFGARAAKLEGTKTGDIFLGQLRENYDALLSLPPAAADDRSLTERRKDVNDRHDGLGRSIYYLLEGYKHRPDLAAAERQEAQDLQKEILPEGLSELIQRFDDEGAAAVRDAPKLEALRPRLARYPIAGGKSLADLAAAYWATGPEYLELSSRKSDQKPTEEEKAARGKARMLVMEASGLITQATATLLRELKSNPALDRDLPRQAFGLFEDLRQEPSSKPKGKLDAEQPAAEGAAPASE